jgi:hypothetical protein
MMDIESNTIIYLREMLATSVVNDASITGFLSCWAYEEFFHSQLLRRLLESQGVSIDNQRFAKLRRGKPGDYLAIKAAHVLSRFTPHFPAVHMTWGAINELSTLTGYSELIRRTDHPLLRTVLSRVIQDERRHFAFYFNQARTRLRPRSAQWLTSMSLRHFWGPVGTPVRGACDARRVGNYLFGDEYGSRRLAQLDSMIARLPGLEWFNLASRDCVDPGQQNRLQPKYLTT